MTEPCPGFRRNSPGALYDMPSCTDYCARCGRHEDDHREVKMMTSNLPEDDDLLTPTEVAEMFAVDPKTVTRWSQAGKLPSIRTLGGHRRYRYGDVRAAMDTASNR